MTDEHKRCEEALEAANKELAALTYSVSHDLRAPLRTIDGFSEALLEDYEKQLDEQGRDYLHRIRNAATAMDQMILALTEMSRVANVELRADDVDVTSVAEVIVRQLEAKEPSRSVDVKIERGLTAHGDPRLLRVVFEQLLGNAWKFTSKRPDARIEVCGAQRDGHRLLLVRDNGAGFDPAHADKMFGAFQRLHSASEFEGAGIGLALARRIVNRHQGRIWAEGNVERGATFYLQLG